jgi:hypothetical protein
VLAGEPAEFKQETFNEGRLSERMSLAPASHGLGLAAVGFSSGPVVEPQRSPSRYRRAAGKDHAFAGPSRPEPASRRVRAFAEAQTPGVPRIQRHYGNDLGLDGPIG